MPLKIDARDWPAISALFDQALDLPASERDLFVAALVGPQAAHRDTLARLLADQRAVETQDFMQALPRPGVADDDAGQDAGEAVPEGGRDVGPYRLLRELGRGGMASVWLAQRSDGLLRREVALKLPHPGLATRAFAERLARERDILAALAHPHIARLYDAGVTAAGQPFIALAYVQGQHLIEHCDAAGLGLRERIVLFQQVLDAVQYAHAHLVIHRDLKPSNVLVDGEGQVHLLDFGIAKLMTDGAAHETELTALEGRALTPDYASPEQVAGRPLGTASDVYSLGVLLFELLCGARPYRIKRGSRAELEEAILAAEPLRPSQLAGDAARAAARGSTPQRLVKALRGDLDAIACKALAKLPEQRYPSADAFARDLDRWLAGEAVLAQPERAWRHALRVARRHRVGLGLGAAVLLALASALAVALWEARQARVEARAAQAAQGFLQDIFNANSAEQSDPVRARRTSARELLDIGAAKIDQALKDAPQARLRMLTTLAGMYQGLGLPDRGVPLLREAVAEARRLQGPRSAELAGLLVDLAAAIEQADQPGAEAQAALSEAQAIVDAQGGDTSALRARLYLAQGRHDNKGNAARAVVELGQAIELLKRQPPSADLVEALNLRGMTRGMSGDPHGAIDDLNEAVAFARQPAVRAKATLPGLYSQLATNEFRLQSVENAERSHRAAVEAAHAVNSADNVDSAELLRRLAYCLLQTSRTEEGWVVARQSAEMAQRLHVEQNSNTVALPRGLLAYASAWMTRGVPDESLRQSLAATASWPQGPEPRRIDAELLEQQANVLTDLGRTADAQRAIDDAQAIRQRIGDLNTPSLLTFLHATRAKLQIRRGDFDGAAASVAKLPAGGAATMVSMSADNLRADLALARGKDDEARAVAERTLKLLADSPNRRYWKHVEARAALTLGRALMHTRQAEAALPLLRRAHELSLELYDRQRGIGLADAQLALAACLRQLRREREADGLWQQARAIQASYSQLDETLRQRLSEIAVSQRSK